MIYKICFFSVLVEMNTRSRAKEYQEVKRSIERKKRPANRDNIVTPYKLKSTMGRKEGNSTKATHSRSKQNVESCEKAEVAPIRLFSLRAEDTLGKMKKFRYALVTLHSVVNLFKFYESHV